MEQGSPVPRLITDLRWNESARGGFVRYRTFGRLVSSMPRADYYQEQARRLMSMARTARHPDFAAQLEAQARLYLSLARIRASPASDLTALLNEFNARQMRELRKSWEDEQAGPVPDRLAQLLAQLERADSPSGGPSQLESRPSASADSSSSALARKS